MGSHIHAALAFGERSLLDTLYISLDTVSMRHLGIDFGTKKVGLAISNEAGTIAEPLEIVPNDEQLVQRVRQVCDAYDVETIVIGASIDTSGADNPVMDQIRPFGGTLDKRLDREVVLEDESMTTFEAARMEENKPKLDASAAALILQRYLEKHA